MARRSAVGHGRESAVIEEAPVPGALGSSVDPWELPQEAGRRGRPGGGGGKGGGGRWGGSGGRWWVWVGRAVLWALILVILVNGIRAPFERFTAGDTGNAGAPEPTETSDFPSSAAGAFALQFGNVYLNYDQKAAPARAEQLRTYVPEGADQQFGWNGVGQLQVQSVQVAGVDARDANNGTVTLLARSADNWYRLAVPVYSKNGTFVISGRPALLPPPAKATLPQTGVRDRDTALEGVLQPYLGPFFQAYARNEQQVLSLFSAGTPIVGLAGSVTFVQVREVVAPKGPANGRTVTVKVAWQVLGAAAAGTGAELEQTYRLEMVKKGATWYVRDIRGTTEPSAS